MALAIENISDYIDIPVVAFLYPKMDKIVYSNPAYKKSFSAWKNPPDTIESFAAAFRLSMKDIRTSLNINGRFFYTYAQTGVPLYQITIDLKSVGDTHIVVCMIYDILKHMGVHILKDPLTDIFGRAGLNLTINRFLKEAKKGSCAIYVIDIDNFKIINDIYGHLSGDEVLKHFAKRLARFAGNEDIFGRYGGDEFILLRMLNPSDNVDEIKNKMFEALRIKYKNMDVLCSAGCVVYDGIASFEDFFAAADKQLIEYKRKRYSPSGYN